MAAYAAGMNDGVRRTVAYVAARFLVGPSVTAIYDYTTGGHFQFSGEVSRSSVNVYDYGRGCHFGGSPPSLYDYGESHHVEFKLEGAMVKGYDYGASCHYEAKVNGKNINIYDYGVGSYFQYSV
jgi:hypothetical protein